MNTKSLAQFIVQVGPLSLLLIACAKPAEKTPEAATDSVVSSAPASTTPAPGDTTSERRPKLTPIDQADASFRAFREQTLAALARKDTTYLYSILSPAIKSSFGGDDRIAGFKKIWKMDKPESSEVWSKLTRVLQMGGKMQDSTFVAPYVYAFWPDSIDAFEFVALTKPPYSIVKRNEKLKPEEYYSPVDWRAFFVRRATRWSMDLFVAGD